MTRCTLAAFACAFCVAACAPTQPLRPARDGGPAPAEAGAEVVAANSNLVVRGIPPIPASVAAEVARYNDFRGDGFVDWHPTKREMLVARRKAGGNTTQIFRVSGPLAEPEQLTDFADPVRSASYEPVRGDYIVFERSNGGDEAGQLYRLDLATRAVTQISVAGQRHSLEAWLHRSSRLLYSSVPLDRTASSGTRTEVTQTLTIVDPRTPAEHRRVAELPGGGWNVGGVSWDDRQAVLTRYLSANDSQIWLLDLASGARRQVLPLPGGASATHFADEWKRDSSGFYFISDRGGEFRELMFFRVADGHVTPITHRIPWDVASVSQSADGHLLAVRLNVEGRDELRFFDGDSFHELPAPAVPQGSVATARFHRTLPVLALAVNSSRSPSQVAALDPRNGATEPWTRPYVPLGVDTSRFGAQKIVHWKSFDGHEISGIVNLPPPRFTGRRPVLIQIHGGPESQAKFGFIGRYNYFVEELGIALIQPNVRGSSGFGKTFLALDDGMKREDSVKDIGALLDWIGRQPDLDASRVMVSGGSYGGYMSLAVATHYADRIAGAIDVVGISSFVSFLEHTESYRRDLRRVEYGDERDPAMRAFLLRIAPLTHAAKITRPLLVVQGRNDPRVPYTEAEQIVDSVRANGTPVWYLRAENEGHGFARKENADFQFYAMVMFMRENLLK
ncbi:MAG: prolyl oligopeptidase family serine peptidase [Caldimonas sp.]